jgi:Cysteine rich repeat
MMKYDLSSRVAHKSSESAHPMTAARKKYGSSIYTLVGGVVLMSIGAYDAANVAHAQGGQGAIRQACAADYQSLCSDVQPGGGRILACLRQNVAKLSPPCQKALAGAKKPQ